MAIKQLRLMADFETTTDPDDVRVWAGCALDIDTLEVKTLTNSIEEFFDYLKDYHSVVYWHNLKFDGEFILSYLFDYGFKLSKKPEPYTFDCLITEDGVFYSITIIFDKQNKKYKKCTIYDSLKKLPFKVAQIAKAFKLEDSKLHIDYDAPRPIGHQLTEEEREYILADCRIVAQALHTQFDSGLTKMTNASDAMTHFKETIGKQRFEKLFPVFPYDMDWLLRKAYKGGYVYCNPKYKNKRGLQGKTYDVNSLYPSVMYNELLPWGYPVYYEGEYAPDDRFPLYICRIRADFELKPGKLPILQLKNNRSYKETEYLIDSRDSNGDWVYPEFTVTSVDLEMIKDHYTLIDPEYKWGYKFKGMQGIFKPYIDYWMHIKATTKGAMRTLAKLMLNSLYGRFALNPRVVNKLPYKDDKGVVRYVATDTKNEALKPYVEAYQGFVGEDRRDAVYTPMACFITAYARKKTIATCQALYPRFIYADTDSCHITGFDTPDNIQIHETDLGAWKHEGDFVDSVFIRQKTYMESMLCSTDPGRTGLKDFAQILNKTLDVWVEGNMLKYINTTVTCAGMPDDIKYTDPYNPDGAVTYDNFKPGATFWGKLTPKRRPGGIVLTPGPFTIH